MGTINGVMTILSLLVCASGFRNIPVTYMELTIRSWRFLKDVRRWLEMGLLLQRHFLWVVFSLDKRPLSTTTNEITQRIQHR